MIEVNNLGKFYGEFEALTDLSFTVGRGEIVGFLGPNGAGKTTTMKILTGYLSATSGHFRVAGFDGYTQSLDVRRNIGYLPENAPLYPDMGVVEYLNFVCDLRQIDRGQRVQRVGKIIETCGLRPMVQKDIGELSKGYRQRVGLAQALIHDPSILILDEPTSGLDPNQIVEIRKLIQNLGQERTIILSTHNLPEVQMTCSRMIIIADGRKVADGTAEELEHQGTEQVRYVVGVKLNSDAELADVTSQLAGLPNVAHVEATGLRDNGHRFTVDAVGENDLSESIFQWAGRSGKTLVELRRDVMDLEKIFHKLTQY
ncbi:MAG TPA: ATP-binding cassette domain-containing protein [Myxococcales bacterium]|nr:ATP-binding cassette domain-containing protein [Myxococcales bacterium]HIN85543.1 ATP-binding cassette domain-containing protein [Myxococcales bacterium]